MVAAHSTTEALVPNCWCSGMRVEWFGPALASE
jgi:hypothetical protein